MVGLETSSLPHAEKVLLRFVDRVNQDSATLTPVDLQPVLEAGWTEEAIYDVITVCALFNFYNRWIDATGVHPMTEESHRAAAARMAPGYLRTPSK